MSELSRDITLLSARTRVEALYRKSLAERDRLYADDAKGEAMRRPLWAAIARADALGEALSILRGEGF